MTGVTRAGGATVTVSVARPVDVDRLAEVSRIASRSPWSGERLAAELGRSDRVWLLATAVDAVPVGVAGIADLAGSAHVLDVAVVPEWRGRGVGRALLAGLLETADSWDVDGVTLEVRSSDARARRMYGRAGFVESGVRRGYYPDGDDAAIAWRR